MIRVKFKLTVAQKLNEQCYRTGDTIRLTIEGKLDHSSIGVW